MDTGLGREGYSIIGQGKIDEILSVKSADRREVFEEAAGISRFRHRKEEAERKLERTEENLVRINDKIDELELQVEPLRAPGGEGQEVPGPPGRAAGAGDLRLAGAAGAAAGRAASSWPPTMSRPPASRRQAQAGAGDALYAAAGALCRPDAGEGCGGRAASAWRC